MKNYLNRFICCVALLTGVVSLPFFGYAQQDEPKRVSIVVVAKEVSSTKEIVQLPATNLPIAVGNINKAKTYRSRAVVSSTVKKPAVSPSIVKESVVTKKPTVLGVVSKKSTPAVTNKAVKEVVVAKAKPAVKLAPTKVEVVKKPTNIAAVSKKSTPTVANKIVKEAVVEKAKPVPLATTKPAVKSTTTLTRVPVKKTTDPVLVKNTPPVAASKTVEEVVIVTKKDVVVLPPAKPAVTPGVEVAKNNSPSANTTNTSTTVPLVTVTKEDRKVVDEFSATDVTAANDLDEAQVSHGNKVNALSYIWIGFFLMLAGVVLGLLFGKPAFLVSVAGVIFIVLGFMI